MSVFRIVPAAMIALALVACFAPLVRAADEAHAAGEHGEADPLSFDPDLAVWTIGRRFRY